jgi:hypothetical protein
MYLYMTNEPFYFSLLVIILEEQISHSIRANKPFFSSQLSQSIGAYESQNRQE